MGNGARRGPGIGGADFDRAAADLVATLAAVFDDAHPVGTCRTGTPGDPAAVVETDCRVTGYEQLPVCDASVMP